MKKSIIRNAILVIGLIPFVLPFIFGIYKITVESWALFDWLVMYSYIFWPTYIAGLICIAIYVCLLIIKKKNENQISNKN